MKKWKNLRLLEGVVQIVEHTDAECTASRRKNPKKYLAPISCGFVNIYRNGVFDGWCGVNFANALTEVKVSIGYKLFRKRKDGTYGPLFINRAQKLHTGLWYDAFNIPTKGYAVRPGWHICGKKSAPHLKMKPDRVWCRVQYFDAVSIQRPESQGGIWWLAKRMRIMEEVST